MTNEELRKFEEALPRIKECELEKSVGMVQSKKKKEWDMTVSTQKFLWI